jgi:3',5'-cyclic AMP phosphodiesterase CpdA
MVIAHLSDLHVSRHGEHVTSLKRARSLQRVTAEWERLVEPGVEEEGWRLERRQRKRWLREDLLEVRLIDQVGYVQRTLKLAAGDEAQGKRILTTVCKERLRTEHARLAARLPAPSEVELLLAGDPTNTNLLFLRAAHAISEAKPEWILLTGDLTDDGIGYDLVVSAFRHYVDKGRLLAIPGNHDTYDSPTLVVPAHERKSRVEKRALWAEFARVLGLPDAGAWVREVDGAIVVGMDSCWPARTPLSASGLVPPDDLDTIAEELARLPGDRLRIAMLHHHVINMPFRHTNRSPWQLGMRLRNAKEVFDFFVDHHFSLVLNGHRHVGYRYHPAHAPMFVSAPSATLGCRSGAPPFWWRIKVDGPDFTVREVTLGK